MSIIQKRTLFVNDNDGVKRFHDWATVVTPIGVMAEPFQQIGARGALQLDWEDEMTRVDDILGFTNGAEQLVLPGDHLHGGFNCRTGK